MDYKQLKTIIRMVDECDDVIKRVKASDVSDSMKACLMQGVLERRTALLSQIESPIVNEYI